MNKIIELEMRVKILEKMFQDLLNEHSIIKSPSLEDEKRIKMEAYQEMKKKYPNEKIEHPK